MEAKLSDQLRFLAEDLLHTASSLDLIRQHFTELTPVEADMKTQLINSAMQLSELAAKLDASEAPQ